MSENGKKENGNGIPASVARIVADLSHEDGRLAGALETLAMSVSETNQLVRSRPCIQHGERLDALERGEPKPTAGGPYRKPPTGTEFAAVGRVAEKATERIDEHVGEVTQRFRLEAKLVAQEAAAEVIAKRRAEEIAALEVDGKRIELQHKRAVMWIKVAALAIGLLGGGSGIAVWRAVSNAEDGQRSTEQLLKKIEKHEQKLLQAHPDAGW